jgi:hypothetical protein
MVSPKMGGTGGKTNRGPIRMSVSQAERIVSQLPQKTGKAPLEQIHLVLHPVESVKTKSGEGWKDQQVWYGIAESQDSSFWNFIFRCRDYGVLAQADIDKADNVNLLADFVIAKIKGKELTWKEEMIGKSIKPKWVPCGV